MALMLGPYLLILFVILPASALVLLDPGVDLPVEYLNFISGIRMKAFTKLFWNSTSQNIYESCKVFEQDKTNEILSRCYSLMTYTMRNFKIYYANAVANDAHQSLTGSSISLYERLADDGLLYASSYIYDNSLLSAENRKARKVCVMGKFSFKLSFFVLMSIPQNFELWIFPNVDDRLSTRYLHYFQEIATRYNRNVRIIRGGLAEWTNIVWDLPVHMRRICDILHFRDSEAEEDIRLVLDLFTTPSADSNALSPLEIIWERTSQDRVVVAKQEPKWSIYGDDILQGLGRKSVNWEWSSKWLSHLGVIPRIDSHGFMLQAYDIAHTDSSMLTDIWLGRTIRRPEPVMHRKSQSASSDQATDESGGKEKRGSERGSERGRGACPSGWHDQLVLITYTNPVFADNALGLRDVIARLGFADVVATGDFNLQDYRSLFPQSVLRRENDNETVSICKVLQVVIGAHELSLVTPHYVAVDVEQSWTQFLLPMYKAVLFNAAAVFTMSAKHSEKVITMADVSPARVHSIPLFTRTVDDIALTGGLYLHQSAARQSRPTPFHRSNRERDRDRVRDKSSAVVDSVGLNDKGEFPENLQTQLDGIETLAKLNKSPLIVAWQSSSIDILFFGSCSERRREFVSLLQEISEASEGTDSDDDAENLPQLVNFLRCTSTWPEALLDDERDHAISQAKVVMNVHTYPTSSLEVHRVNLLLSKGKCVVSERSSFDPELDDQYKHGVLFADTWEEMIEMAITTAREPALRAACENRALSLFHKIDSDTAVVEKVLRSIFAEME